MLHRVRRTRKSCDGLPGIGLTWNAIVRAALPCMAKEPITPNRPEPAEPDNSPVKDPQPYQDPARQPPADPPPHDRPLQDPVPPSKDLPRM